MIITKRKLERILARRDEELARHIMEKLEQRENDSKPVVLRRRLPDNVVRLAGGDK